MAIVRSIETRLCERIETVLQADADLIAICPAAKIFRGSFFDGANRAVQPRQLHIYPFQWSKEPDVGEAWDTQPSVGIEYFVPRNVEQPFGVTSASVTAWDEARHIANLLFKGEGPQGPPVVSGRFKDPADLSLMLTIGIDSVDIASPIVSEKQSAILFFITARFISREDALGARK